MAVHQSRAELRPNPEDFNLVYADSIVNMLRKAKSELRMNAPPTNRHPSFSEIDQLLKTIDEKKEAKKAKSIEIKNTANIFNKSFCIDSLFYGVFHKKIIKINKKLTITHFSCTLAVVAGPKHACVDAFAFFHILASFLV